MQKASRPVTAEAASAIEDNRGTISGTSLVDEKALADDEANGSAGARGAEQRQNRNFDSPSVSAVQ